MTETTLPQNRNPRSTSSSHPTRRRLQHRRKTTMVGAHSQRRSLTPPRMSQMIQHKTSPNLGSMTSEETLWTSLILLRKWILSGRLSSISRLSTARVAASTASMCLTNLKKITEVVLYGLVEQNAGVTAGMKAASGRILGEEDDD